MVNMITSGAMASYSIGAAWLGLIACVTPVIDSYHAVLSLLGERFVMLRVLQGICTETAKKALDQRWMIVQYAMRHGQRHHGLFVDPAT